MSRLATLKAATSLSDLARLLDFKPSSVSYILYMLPPAAKYVTFHRPKRNGGQRTIKAPVDALKVLQRKLSDLLQDCMAEINAAKGRRDRTAHGFKRGLSILTNGRQHRCRRWVFNLDLEEFFPSINFGRVRGFLLKNRDFELHEKVATVIAQIACDANSLPQGSPCSPVISNLLAHLLDIRLVKLASQAGCTYSRYADDLTFSTNKRDFPVEVAVRSGADGAAAHSWLPGEPLRDVIERTGFRINAAKTHMMYRSSRQEVTGLVVNKKINVQSRYRHNVRAMVDRLIKTGSFETFGLVQKDGRPGLEKRLGTFDQLHGMLGFIDTIDVCNKRESDDRDPEKMSSSEKIYKRFLIYSTFYAAKAPVVVCEGGTDNIYLTHAIRSLAADFPDLAELLPDRKIRLKVRLYKYPRSSTARLLELKDGGTGGLANFIAAYKRETSRFTGPGLTNPVVILYDNDSGANSIWSAIKNASGVRPTGAEPFVHVFKNMYAVPTPFGPNGALSRIEDFFEDNIKETAISGKAFNPGNDFDKDKHYGKVVFAHRVVRPKADSINFTGFRPLLTNLVAAINKHRASMVPRTPRP